MLKDWDEDLQKIKLRAKLLDERTQEAIKRKQEIDHSSTKVQQTKKIEVSGMSK